MRAWVVLFCLLAACQQEPKKPAVDSNPATGMVVETPKPLPDFDFSLESIVNINAWLSKVETHMKSAKDLVDPRARVELSKLFQRPARAIDAFLEVRPCLPAVADRPKPPPSKEEAKKFEKNGEHWAAGEMYADLRDAVGLRRCLNVLRQEGEWTVVAELASRVPDEKTFNDAADKLAKSRQFSRLYDVFVYAAEHGRADDVRATIHRLNLHPEEEIGRARSLARAGLTDYLGPALEASLPETAWWQDHPDVSFRDVFLLAKDDRAEARKLLKTYLSKPGAVVLAQTHVGEGDETVALQDAAALWNFVKNDAELTRLYTRAVNDLFAPNPEDTNQAGDLRAALPSLAEVYVEAAKDKKWVAVLDAALDQAPPYVRQASRLMLGFHPIPGTNGLAPRERYLIDWLSGRTPKTEDLLPTESESDLRIEEVFSVLEKGTVSAANAQRLWTELELPDQDAHVTGTIARSDFPKTIDAINALGYSDPARTDHLWASLVLSGSEKLPDAESYYFTNYPQTIRAAVFMKRPWKAIPIYLGMILQEAVDRSTAAEHAWHAEAHRLLKYPFEVLQNNRRAYQRAGLSLDNLENQKDFMSAARAEELFARGFEATRTHAPVDRYEALLVEYAKAGYEGPFNDELKRRVDANDIDGLRRLQKLRAGEIVAQP